MSQDVRFIGPKQIKEVTETEEKTPGGNPILKVEYEDGVVEMYSKVMFDLIVSPETCDLTQLREKRLAHLISATLVILREYGMKIGETAHFGLQINELLNSNIDEAQRELWAKWMPKPLSLDEVDFVTVDRVLRSIKPQSDGTAK